MNDKREFYLVSWKQIYTEWQNQIDNIDKQMDQLIDATGYKDAKEVINRIKENLK